jgi:hypothetical protein
MSILERMRTPKTRAEFERAIHIAAENLRQGKMSFPMDSEDYVHSLRSVRVLPNGRVDFLSVDESARLHANQITNMIDSNWLRSERFASQIAAEKPAPDDGPATTAKGAKKARPKKSGVKKASELARKKGVTQKHSPKRSTKKGSEAEEVGSKCALPSKPNAKKASKKAKATGKKSTGTTEQDATVPKQAAKRAKTKEVKTKQPDRGTTLNRKGKK